MNVEEVFVFCFNLEKHRKWASLYNKVKSVENKIETIIESLHRQDYLLSYADVGYK